MDRAGRRLGNKVGKWSSKGYADYSDVLVVHEHGEIGPVLGFRGDHFTGPSDIAH